MGGGEGVSLEGEMEEKLRGGGGGNVIGMGLEKNGVRGAMKMGGSWVGGLCGW